MLQSVGLLKGRPLMTSAGIQAFDGVHLSDLNEGEGREGGGNLRI